MISCLPLAHQPVQLLRDLCLAEQIHPMPRLGHPLNLHHPEALQEPLEQGLLEGLLLKDKHHLDHNQVPQGRDLNPHLRVVRLVRQDLDLQGQVFKFQMLQANLPQKQRLARRKVSNKLLGRKYAKLRLKLTCQYLKLARRLIGNSQLIGQLRQFPKESKNVLS